MRFVIKHEIKGRLRVHILQSRMSFAQADTLQYYLDGQKNIVSAKIQERTYDGHTSPAAACTSALALATA